MPRLMRYDPDDRPCMICHRRVSGPRKGSFAPLITGSSSICDHCQGNIDRVKEQYGARAALDYASTHWFQILKNRKR